MGERIVFQTGHGSVAVLIPAECGLTIKQIGEKDVPEGAPFWVVDATDIPADRTYRDAWELGATAMGEPSGYGAPKA